MIRQAPVRAALRQASSAVYRPSQFIPQRVPRRFASTVPADKPRSWRSGLLRWIAAGAIVYYYNTTNIFAEAGSFSQPTAQSDNLPTLESIAAERRQRAATQAKVSAPPASDSITAAASGALDEVKTTAQDVGSAVTGAAAEAGESMSPEELEQEAGQEGAFNPETGEINWDCPCLGGMAHGPCGEQFKAAFSCFVFSKEEPKGVDCIDKFKHMQDCFREHPDIYGAELSDDDDLEDDEAQLNQETAAAAQPKDSKTDATSDPQRPAASSASPGEASKSVAKPSAETSKSAANTSSPATPIPAPNPETGDGEKVGDKKSAPGSTKRAEQAKAQVQQSQGGAKSESDEMVPKAWHDATGEGIKTEK